MSNSRRDFLKQSTLLASGLSFSTSLPGAITRAMEIDPLPGTSFLDAEHIVFLMQENRSFDHCYGTLSGVRGFNDPRAMLQPNGLPVWFQTNAAQQIYGPFHLDIHNTQITWMGGLPHSWKDMVGARSNGNMDHWLISKAPSNLAYKHMPLTMGYYTQQDIPFYYALADAFTVCDQHFCSSLTGTSANRSFFWSGAIREQPLDASSVAHVDNSQINYKNVSWTTYPERLQKAGVSWKVYQNELSINTGLSATQEDWLANFTDNNLEFYQQYNVKFHAAHYQWMQLEAQRIEKALAQGGQGSPKKQDLTQKLAKLQQDLITYSASNFSKLPLEQQQIHNNAFVTNTQDPAYRELESMDIEVQGQTKTIQVPKGDIFAQFRKDVAQDALPTVSYLVAPCNFSDHPSAPWFGAWYVSEVMNILTQNPAIWQKTIFVLTYDENDGYFDHVAPFTPALSTDPTTGSLPKSMDTTPDWITTAQEIARTKNNNTTLSSPIGLGYRVPMVIASAWTKGGWVNSEVMDLTSTIQFLEYFLEHKYGKKVVETNLTPWRRAVCGNMTSLFHQADYLLGLKDKLVDKKNILTQIYAAKDKPVPVDFNLYTKNQVPTQRPYSGVKGFPVQQKGVRNACALPCNMQLDLYDQDGQLFLDFSVQSTPIATKVASGVAQGFARVDYQQKSGQNWSFTALEKHAVSYSWDLEEFDEQGYVLDFHGPNGFYRSFKAALLASDLKIKVVQRTDQSIYIRILNSSDAIKKVLLTDSIYTKDTHTILVDPAMQAEVVLDYKHFKGWYDFVVTVVGQEDFEYHYAGHIEDGQNSITDPYMASFSN